MTQSALVNDEDLGEAAGKDPEEFFFGEFGEEFMVYPKPLRLELLIGA